MVWSEVLPPSVKGAVIDRSARGAGPVQVLATGQLAYGGPAVAWVGDGYYVAWTVFDGLGQYVTGVRVGDAGVEVPDGGPTFRADGGTDPAVAWNGQRAVVAWKSVVPGSQGIYLIGLDDLMPVGERLGTGDDVAARPRLASDGRNWAVTWTERSGGDEAVHLSLVENDMSYGVPLGAAAPNQRFPTVAFDSAHWVVVWQQLEPTTGAYSLQGVELDPDGGNISPLPRVTDRGLMPRLTVRSDGLGLLTYQAFDPTPTVYSVRAYGMRLFSLSYDGGAPRDGGAFTGDGGAAGDGGAGGGRYAFTSCGCHGVEGLTWAIVVAALGLGRSRRLGRATRRSRRSP